MSVGQTKAAVRRWLEDVLGKGTAAAVDGIAGDDFVWHCAPPGVGSDREGYKQFLRMDFEAFANVSCATEDIVAGGRASRQSLDVASDPQG